MTKQEELEKGADEVILKCLKDGWIKPYEIRHFVFSYLHSQGVVIKVERGHDSDCSVHNMPAYQNGPCDCVELPAGCVAVEPLIGE